MNSKKDSISFNESIKNAEQALSLCLCNKFNKAEEFLTPLDASFMYHNISLATISYLQAILTYEQEFIDKAYLKVKEASTLCDKYRKKQSWGETLQSLVGKPNFDDFTELQLHAELCYAECLLERAMLTFIQDENLISFIKGGLKIRNAYNMYRHCLVALEKKPKVLEGAESTIHFDTGVYMGVGSFNLLLSLLPPRVLRLLEWVGFSGDKDKGIMWLNKGFELDGLRSPMCCITLLVYQIVVAPLLGIDDSDLPYSERILNFYLEKFPTSSIFLYFSGRLKQTQGLLHEALAEYNQSVSMSIDWQQIHHICYWEMMWCHSFLGNWEQAAHFAGKLSTESKWSKSAYMYMQASYMIMLHFEYAHSNNAEKVKEGEQLKEKYHKILLEVPKYKQRIAGKSIPFEKFAISRVEKYQTTGALILPGIEIIHIWNGFTMFKDHKNVLETFLKAATTSLEELDPKTYSNKKDFHDNECICKLIQGICLRHLKKFEEAEKILLQVASSVHALHSCKIDCYLPPYASCELGFLYKSKGEHSKALFQLQHTLKHYSKYGLESRLHFRIHSGIENLKEILNKKDTATPNTSPLPRANSPADVQAPDVYYSLEKLQNTNQSPDKVVENKTEIGASISGVETEKSVTNAEIAVKENEEKYDVIVLNAENSSKKPDNLVNGVVSFDADDEEFLDVDLPQSDDATKAVDAIQASDVAKVDIEKVDTDLNEVFNNSNKLNGNSREITNNYLHSSNGIDKDSSAITPSSTDINSKKVTRNVSPVYKSVTDNMIDNTSVSAASANISPVHKSVMKSPRITKETNI